MAERKEETHKLVAGLEAARWNEGQSSLCRWADVSPSARAALARATARALAEETTAVLLGEAARGR